MFKNFKRRLTHFIRYISNFFLINFLLKYFYKIFNFFYYKLFKKDYLFINAHLTDLLKYEKTHFTTTWYKYNLKTLKVIHNRQLWNSFFVSRYLGHDNHLMLLLHNQYKIFKTENHRFSYRLNFFKNGFYKQFLINTPISNIKSSLNYFLTGWSFFLKFFSKWFMPLLLVASYVFYAASAQALPAVRIVFVWTSVFSVVYLLISGFVFFFKKYQYGKFTSVIQRFWKRSLVLFWLIEGSLLIVFFYLTINSTWYLYNVWDQAQLFRTFLFSWRLFLLKIIPTTLLLLLTFIFLINNKWQTLTKNSLFLIVITSLLLFITWIEFYQFYHVINYHHGKTWFYHKEDREWVIDQDYRKTSGTKSFVNIMLILKFWHILFITGMWLFFVLRSNESERIRYPLITGNFLNFIMLYILSWVYMYPWFKIVSKQYFSYSYKWFYSNNRNLGLRVFFNDIYLLLLSLMDYKYISFHYFGLISFKKEIFFFMKPSGFSNGFVDFNKRFSSNQILGDMLHINLDRVDFVTQSFLKQNCRIFGMLISRFVSFKNFLFKEILF